MKLLKEKLSFIVKGMENNLLIPLSISFSTWILTSAIHYMDTHDKTIMAHENYEAYMKFSNIIYTTGYSASAVFLGIFLILGSKFLMSKTKTGN